MLKFSVEDSWMLKLLRTEMLRCRMELELKNPNPLHGNCSRRWTSSSTSSVARHHFPVSWCFFLVMRLLSSNRKLVISIRMFERNIHVYTPIHLVYLFIFFSRWFCIQSINVLNTHAAQWWLWNYQSLVKWCSIHMNAKAYSFRD